MNTLSTQVQSPQEKQEIHLSQSHYALVTIHYPVTIPIYYRLCPSTPASWKATLYTVCISTVSLTVAKRSLKQTLFTVTMIGFKMLAPESTSDCGNFPYSNNNKLCQFTSSQISSPWNLPTSEQSHQQKASLLLELLRYSGRGWWAISLVLYLGNLAAA